MKLGLFIGNLIITSFSIVFGCFVFKSFSKWKEFQIYIWNRHKVKRD